MATATIAPQDPTIIEFDVRTDEMLVNMGPQHPSTHGVLRLVLKTDGEVISEVMPHMGYLHRCAEKIGENVTPIQFIPYTDRMDYLAGMNMNLGYSMAVEKLAGMKIPEKAQVIRVIICELNRIASHLVAMGTYGLDLGTFSPFLYAFREREQILDLFEEVCGARLTYSYITIGGVHDDLPEGWIDRCQKFLDYFKPRIDEYHTLLTTNHIFVKRTANIGNMSKEMALAHGCTGPMLRGSLDRTNGDPEWDLRKVEPYCGYEGYSFKAIIPPFNDEFYDDQEFGVRPRTPATAVIGDSWHRYEVRMLEVVESVKIIEQGLKKYATAQGSHRIEPPRHLPAGEAYVETECPRGQMGFYVVGRATKENVPLRVRARSSSFCNLSVTNEISRGCLIADVPAIVGSIDIVMGEIDR
ncbi:MAG TPA: NADH-quinone oxidoreductase subunit D [Gemmataceae bacterium]|nr:NADH-quinone oxidoreductase subunit D [Gemmataceae bacterium]